MFTSLNDIRTALENTLHKNPATLDPTLWTPILDAANNWAYFEIVSRLGARGFSLSIVNQWDLGFSYQRSLAMFYALDHQSAVSPTDVFSRDNLKDFDLRDSLSGNPKASPPVEPVFVTIGGLPRDPDMIYGQAIAGVPNISTDQFVWQDPSDPRIGQPMRI